MATQNTLIGYTVTDANGTPTRAVITRVAYESLINAQAIYLRKTKDNTGRLERDLPKYILTWDSVPNDITHEEVGAFVKHGTMATRAKVQKEVPQNEILPKPANKQTK